MIRFGSKFQSLVGFCKVCKGDLKKWIFVSLSLKQNFWNYLMKWNFSNYFFGGRSNDAFSNDYCLSSAEFGELKSLWLYAAIKAFCFFLSECRASCLNDMTHKCMSASIVENTLYGCDRLISGESFDGLPKFLVLLRWLDYLLPILYFCYCRALQDFPGKSKKMA